MQYIRVSQIQNGNWQVTESLYEDIDNAEVFTNEELETLENYGVNLIYEDE